MQKCDIASATKKSLACSTFGIFRNRWNFKVIGVYEDASSVNKSKIISLKKSWIEYCWTYQEMVDSRVKETENKVYSKRICMHRDGKYINKSLRKNEETDVI